jgi:hypothetical protein
MIEHALFVTGMQRSGTTLLERLLAAQRGVSMLSQPFPFLFSDTKRAFLRTVGGGDEIYPLGHLFGEERYDSRSFARFLSDWRTSPAELSELFARLSHYSGQYTRFSSAQIDDVIGRLPLDQDFAAVVASLDRELAGDDSAAWFGSKEVVCEEFVPPLLDRGFHGVIIVRDPRDVVSSLNHGQGRSHAGELKPTLFNIRNWRKSVTIAMAMQKHARFGWCRYEDLVAGPSRELSRLGFGAVVPGVLRNADGSAWRGNSSHVDHDGVSLSSVTIYRKLLPPGVAAFIEATCLRELEALGYETTLSRRQAAEVISAFREPYPSIRTGFDSDEISPESVAIEIARLAE